MYKSLVLILFIASLISFPPFHDISAAQNERGSAALMKEHMKRMKNRSPEKYQRMEKSAQGGVSDCISCHKQLNNKKSHFRFQFHDDQVKTRQ